MNNGWPENVSGQRWEAELYASEWMVRRIIDSKDGGNGVSTDEIERDLQSKLKRIISSQNSTPHFFFTLGADLTLREWLANEAGSDRLQRLGGENGERYRLSTFMRNLLRYRERGGLEKLISQTTGVEDT